MLCLLCFCFFRFSDLLRLWHSSQHWGSYGPLVSRHRDDRLHARPRVRGHVTREGGLPALRDRRQGRGRRRFVGSVRTCCVHFSLTRRQSVCVRVLLTELPVPNRYDSLLGKAMINDLDLKFTNPLAWLRDFWSHNWHCFRILLGLELQLRIAWLSWNMSVFQGGSEMLGGG